MESFAEYASRVNTFTIKKWPMRHHKLTPTRIARWGFKCLDQSTLQCNSCQVILYITEFSLDIEDCTLKEILYKKLIAQLSKAHSDNCFFCRDQNDDSLLFKINRAFLFQYSFRQYQDNLQTLKEVKQLPTIKFDILKIIPPNLQIVLYDTPTDYEEKRLNAQQCYAIFGWRSNITDKQTEDQEEILNCIYCGRSVKCSNFDTAGIYQTQSEGMKEFDLIDQHRYFCKWANNDPLSNKLYGYGILIQQLYDQYVQSNSTHQTYKRNSMVQITVLRRELVIQLEALKKDQQQLTSELEIIEQENQGIIDRLGKRKRKELDEMIEDKEFHDQLQKKIKAQEQEQIQKKQIENQEKMIQEQQLIPVEDQNIEEESIDHNNDQQFEEIQGIFTDQNISPLQDQTNVIEQLQISGESSKKEVNIQEGFLKSDSNKFAPENDLDVENEINHEEIFEFDGDDNLGVVSNVEHKYNNEAEVYQQDDHKVEGQVLDYRINTKVDNQVEQQDDIDKKAQEDIDIDNEKNNQQLDHELAYGADRDANDLEYDPDVNPEVNPELENQSQQYVEQKIDQEFEKNDINEVDQESDQEIKDDVEQELDQENQEEVEQELDQENQDEVEQELENQQEVEQELEQENQQEVEQELDQENQQEVEQELDQENQQEVQQDVEQNDEQESQLDIEQQVEHEVDHEVDHEVQQEEEKKIDQELNQECDPQDHEVHHYVDQGADHELDHVADQINDQEIDHQQDQVILVDDEVQEEKKN